MKRQVTSPELAALGRHWRRWTALVALHAGRARGAGVVDAQEYQALHQDLLAACAAAGGTARGSGREFYQGLEELARPWLTARVLELTDRDILLDLLARCRRADRELHPPSRLRAGLLRAVPVVALPGAAAAVVLLGRAADWNGLPAREWLLGRVQALGLTAQGSGWWFLLAASAVLLATAVVWRSGRKLTDG
jgi:hypothetical protein